MKSISFDYFPAADGGVMKDICEQYTACNTDQKSFKAYLSRWMAAASQMAPFIYDEVLSLLTTSAKAAAAQCTGTGTAGPPGQACGLKWYLNGTWDGTSGVGQQMAVLEVILGTLIKSTPAPLTNQTGGTSISNPTAGFNSSSIPPGEIIIPPTHREKAAAWVLTAFLLLWAVWTGWFMWSAAWETREMPETAVSSEKGKEKVPVEKRTSSRAMPHIAEDEEKAAPRPLSKVKFKDVIDAT
jgi:mannan endo-1,6-alpha-mannosidase